MRTTTIGEILKEYRQYHKLSLPKLAQKTKIKLAYLEALEKNEFEKLPSLAYIKSYLKKYAQIFGFDYGPLLAILRRDYREDEKGKLIPIEFNHPLKRRRSWWTPLSFSLVALLVVFFSLSIYVVFQWYNLQKPPLLLIESPKEDELVSSKVIVVGEAAVDANVLVNAQKVSLDNEGNFSHEVLLPREGLHTITVEATDRRGKSNVIQRTVRVEF